MSFKGFSIFSSGGHFAQRSRTNSAILVEGREGLFQGNYFEIGLLVYEDMSFKGFCIFSSRGHFVQQSRTILAVLIEGHPRNRSVK